MAADINDLYLLITQQVGPSLENDEYFQYLYNLVNSGDNRINQQHKIRLILSSKILMPSLKSFRNPAVL